MTITVDGKGWSVLGYAGPRPGDHYLSVNHKEVRLWELDMPTRIRLILKLVEADQDYVAS